ncbi:MAG TPA: RagB/SusD family nutrient uptake outer membrane protein [Bacteroidales bacterium]|nr:RagB/SusD family nutrient uptake outer membrane protein [Bacteroidales bacterium]HQG35937.1 RagB/SusD family nutrient uptake outer membrane protein [Bacteroidales bacterium]HQG53650.1 RagB/SusD family nutrient uptake outer membrane protein [Bacteroidales bacterium]HQJ20913.1 RagB/SusD family nutrient uptake outer membrane protein [Bacteroidales bacterium]
MRKYIYLTILSVPLLLVTACDKLLELEPSQNVSENTALGSDENIKSVLIGAYSLFDDPGIYGGNLLRNAELLGGNGEILWTGTSDDPRQIFYKTISATNSDVLAQWVDSYEVINTCNNIVSALEVVKNDDRNRVEGEALFLRALIYFDLVRFFGMPYEAGIINNQPGVPIVLKPSRGIDKKSYVLRNSVEQVYIQVITDLKAAAAKLPEENGVFASRGSANALLARVYLQKGDYDNARKTANEVISSNKYTLLTDYADVFNQYYNTPEDIFATQIMPPESYNSMTIFFSIPEFGGNYGDIEILDSHLSLYPAGDRRKDLFFSGNGAMRCGKWNNLYGRVNLIRLAEMYLIRAESNIRLGAPYVGATPLDDYNTIHTRAGLTPASSVTLNDIILERRLELAFEGHRIHDIKRLKENVGTWTYNDTMLVFPIPARELEVNPMLKSQMTPD